MPCRPSRKAGGSPPRTPTNGGAPLPLAPHAQPSQASQPDDTLQEVRAVSPSITNELPVLPPATPAPRPVEALPPLPPRPVFNKTMPLPMTASAALASVAPPIPAIPPRPRMAETQRLPPPPPPGVSAPPRFMLPSFPTPPPTSLAAPPPPLFTPPTPPPIMPSAPPPALAPIVDPSRHVPTVPPAAPRKGFPWTLAIVLFLVACAGGAVAVVFGLRAMEEGRGPEASLVLPVSQSAATTSTPTRVATSTPTPTPTPTSTSTSTSSPSPSPISPPSAAPTPTKTAPAPSVAVAAVPVASATTGIIDTSDARPGHRIFINDWVPGQTPGRYTVRCGRIPVKLGSQGSVQNVEVPCGGEIEVLDR